MSKEARQARRSTFTRHTQGHRRSVRRTKSLLSLASALVTACGVALSNVAIGDATLELMEEVLSLQSDRADARTACWGSCWSRFKRRTQEPIYSEPGERIHDGPKEPTYAEIPRLNTSGGSRHVSPHVTAPSSVTAPELPPRKESKYGTLSFSPDASK